jgi:hypothetical protein
MAALMSSWPLSFGAMEAASLVMMSGSWHISRNAWRSVDVCLGGAGVEGGDGRED